MKISLRPPRGVVLHNLIKVLKQWKTSFSLFDKAAIGVLVVLIILTSWRWTVAASQYKYLAPAVGGVFTEGVVASSLDAIDLGRLTKSGLDKIDPSGQIAPDLATSWSLSDDKLSYTFVINSKYSSYDISDVLKKNPTAISQAAISLPDQHTIKFTLQEPNNNFLTDLSKPLFPYGPYKLDKKTANEIRLKINGDYFSDKPFIEKFIVRMYKDQNSLQNAANNSDISGAMDLATVPVDFQQKTLTMGKKHILFINSSKSYLKAVKVRDQLLSGQKPDSITTLDVLEVNGVSEDADYLSLKDKLTAANVKLNVRKVSLKDAVVNDLPQRNFDLLYLLVNEGPSHDPYLFYNSKERTGSGQNFAELANADIDKLTNDYRGATDQAQKTDLLNKINDAVGKEKVTVEYKNIESTYAISNDIKGFCVNSICSQDSDRFSQVAKWYIEQKKVR